MYNQLELALVHGPARHQFMNLRRSAKACLASPGGTLTLTGRLAMTVQWICKFVVHISYRLHPRACAVLVLSCYFMLSIIFSHTQTQTNSYYSNHYYSTWAAGAATGEPYSQWARTAPEREIEKKCRQMFGMTVRNNVDGPTRNDCRKAL